MACYFYTASLSKYQENRSIKKSEVLKKSIHQNIKKIHKHSKFKEKQDRSLSENKLEKLFFPWHKT
ncbi:MAG: hypothetical protein BHV91_06525 [Clostridiales bacterium 44_9]|nr:MAG: hypothetical protein BHV91_06525 [Clostridiales bacterium 44_9]